MEPSDDFMFEEKPGRRRRAARWGIMTKGRVARSTTMIRSDTKRPHYTVTIYNHDEESRLHAAARALYKPSMIYGADGQSQNERLARAGLKPDDDRNPNHLMSSSTTTYSLDKHKRWETVEATERKINRTRDGRRALTQSYSDTDDISDDDDVEEDPEIEGAIPGRVVMVKMQEADHEGSYKEHKISEAHHLVVKGILRHEITNDPVRAHNGDEEEENPTRYLVKGRKGFVVKERRPRGKKGVVRPTKKNTHAEEIYDLARADNLVLLTEPIDPKRNYLVRNFRQHEFDCDCGTCQNTDAGKRTKRNRIIKKEMLDQL